MEELSRLTWFYMLNSLITAALVLWITHRAGALHQRIPGRLQNLFELIVDTMRTMFLGALGKGGEKHLPLVFAIFFFVLVGDFLGLVPILRSPTADTNVTMALGIMVFVYVQYYGIKANGLVGYLKHFIGPILPLFWFFMPIEIIGELAKPFSLGMRLFGNIYGEDQLLAQVFIGEGNSVIAHIIPFHLLVNLLQVFTNCVQAIIFAFLTCAYLAIMTGGGHGDSDAHEGAAHGAAAH